MPKDRWPELCRSVAEDDGLPAYRAGLWTEQKLWFWNRYIEITTSSMVGKPAWPAGLCYVDLFAGPGVCQLRENGKRFPGSPLIAAKAPKPFSKILLVEKNTSAFEACCKRLQHTPAAKRVAAISGDCNEVIDQIASQIPPGTLTLAFIDPPGLDAKFETIRRLTTGKRVDLLMLFADAYDILRNVVQYYQDPNSKLDQVLGPDSDWRSRWDSLTNHDGPNSRALFAGIYETQLKRHLGYVKVGHMPICSAHGPLYRLFYASKSERGLDFWDKITMKDAQGQLSLDFG